MCLCQYLDKGEKRFHECMCNPALPLFTESALGLFKSSCYSRNFIEQTPHCDHKPRAAWVYVRLLLHRRSAAGWAECMIYSAHFGVTFRWQSLGGFN